MCIITERCWSADMLHHQSEVPCVCLFASGREGGGGAAAERGGQPGLSGGGAAAEPPATPVSSLPRAAAAAAALGTALGRRLSNSLTAVAAASTSSTPWRSLLGTPHPAAVLVGRLLYTVRLSGSVCCWARMQSDRAFSLNQIQCVGGRRAGVAGGIASGLRGGGLGCTGLCAV